MVTHELIREKQPLGRGVAIGSILLALALAIAPLPRAFVERWYSTGFYTVLQPALTSLSNAVGVALFDVLVVMVVGALILLAWRDVTRCGWWRGAGRIAWRTASWIAALYLAFLVAWGLNYRRLPLVERLPYDGTAVTADAAAKLAGRAVEALNGLYAAAHASADASGAIDPPLAAAFEAVIRDLGAPRRVVVGRPKWTVFNWYFERAGVSGMTDPFLLETLVAGDLLPFERPFVIAHEWSHLAGLVNEGEANVAGWLVCLRGSPANQYSGWLFMYGELSRVLPRSERAALAARLEAGPRADLQAIRDRLARHINPQISNAGWRVYDSYLKANRVEAGTASYDEVVRLALGLKIARSG